VDSHRSEAKQVTTRMDCARYILELMDASSSCNDIYQEGRKKTAKNVINESRSLDRYMNLRLPEYEELDRDNRWNKSRDLAGLTSNGKKVTWRH
jgi:hypothetical protein